MTKQQFVTYGNALLVRAPAKINLVLLIAGKRQDGFHEIKTIMAKVDWYDEIFIEDSSHAGIELLCKGSQWAPSGQDNLIYRAAKQVFEFCGINPSLKITLVKNIPAGSGLGSASSDAASTILALNKYLDLKLTFTEMADIASKLGSDLVFFLGSPLALCTSRGEKINQIAKNFDFKAILILPNINTSTKKVYENYQHDSELFGRLNIKLDQYIGENRLDLVTKMCANMLENSCFRLHPEIAELKARIEHLGITPLCLSGSGSTLYYLCAFPESERIAQYQRILNEDVGCNNIVVSSNNW